MNNLKRVLSTILAGTMLAGMMVVGASAASFSDADKIEHTDAVNTLVALNVINGKDDGTYDPEGIVTRAEMAKLITVTLNGGKDPVLGTKVTPTYTDIKGHWAESYIEYCSSLGIIGGRGDGTFDPNGTVTGTEAAKMMLVAMGWDATIFNFTGADWAINVAVEANKIDLFDELETINPSLGLTRDNTAQLIFNGLLAHIMEKDPSMTITNGEITWGYHLSDSKTLFSEKFGGQELDGVMTFTSTDYNSDKGEYTYTINYIDEEGVADTEEFTTTADYTDLFRQSVRVLYKETKTGTSVYGIFAKGGKVLAETIVGNVSSLSDLNTTTSKVKINGVEYKVDMSATDKDEKGNPKNVIKGAYAFASSTCDSFRTIAANDGYKAFTFQAIDTDNNGKIDTLVYFPFTVEQVTYVGKDTFKAGETVKFSSVTSYEGLAKNDWVKITSAANTADNTAVYEKIDTVISGKVTAIKDGKVKIDGEWYTPVVASDAGLGKAYKDMPVVNGYIFASSEDEGSISVDDYAVLVKAESTKSSELNEHLQGILLLTDGTKTTVELDGNYSTQVGKLVTFKVKDGVYTLSPVGVNDKGPFAGVVGNNADNAQYKPIEGGKSTIGGMNIADDAIVFIATDAGKTSISGAKVISGADLKKDNSGKIQVYRAFYEKNSSTGFNTVTVAYVSGSVSSTSDYQYGYITSWQQIVNDDNETVIELTVWTADGEAVVTTISGLDIKVSAGDVISYKTNEKGLVKELNKISNTDAVVAYDGTNIQFETANSGKPAKITDDTVIIYVSTKDKAGVEGGSIERAGTKIVKDTEGKDTEVYIKNVTVTVSDDKVVVLIVDDANEWSAE